MLMSLVASFVERLAEFVGDWGYLAMLILMTLESAGVPIPSEIVVPFSGFLASRGKMNFWLAVLVATLANVIGSTVLYYVGNMAGEPFIHKYGRYFGLSREHLEAVKAWFDRYGSATVFVGRLLPAVRTYISLPAGVGRMRMHKFLTLTAVGSFLWNLMLAYMGLWLGENWSLVVPWIDLAAAIVVAALVGLLVCIKKGWIRPTEFLRNV